MEGLVEPVSVVNSDAGVETISEATSDDESTKLRSVNRFQSLVPKLAEGRHGYPTLDNNYEVMGQLRWKKLRNIGSVLFPTTSPHGRPSSLLCTSTVMLVGTESADVLAFDYKEQTLSACYQPPPLDERWGMVTALGISDSHLVAGYAFGGVVMWNIATSKVIAAIPALMHPPVLDSPVTINETHMVGTPVRAVYPLKAGLLSADDRGLVIVHHLSDTWFESKRVRSRRLIGRYAAPTRLLGCVIICENAHALTAAALTAQNLVILRTTSAASVEVLLKIPFPSKDTAEATAGFISFHNDLLTYTWDADMSILRLHPTEGFEMWRALSLPQKVMWHGWIEQDILVTSSASTLNIINAPEACVVATCQLPDQWRALATQSGTVVLLGRYELFVGTPPGWGDRLMALLDESRPVAALDLVTQLYQGTHPLVGPLMGLPRDREARQLLVRQAVPDLVMTPIGFAIDHAPEQIPTLLPEAVRVIVITNLPILEPLLELVIDDPNALKAYVWAVYDAIVIQGTLSSLPPFVFKAMAVNIPRKELRNVWFSLDIQSLDLDLSFTICKKYPGLEDVAAYLSNQALHDFVSPLETLPPDDLGDYLAAIFSGIKYPTSEYQEEPLAEKGKTCLWSAIIHRISELLQRERRELLKGLNVGFEDAYLNAANDAGVSRQLVVNTLLHIDETGWEVAAFVALQAAKYRQFIILPGARLSLMLDALIEGKDSPCSSCRQEERELATLALLQIYAPSKSIEPRLRSSGYFLVLERILARRKDWIGVASLHLNDASVWSSLETAFGENRSAASPFLIDHFKDLLSQDPVSLSQLCARVGLELWDLLGTCQNEQKFAYMKTWFENTHSLPPATEYVQLVARYEPEKLLPVLQALGKNVSIPGSVDGLLDLEREDALALLLTQQRRYSEAMIYLVNRILDDGAVPGEDFMRVCLDTCRRANDTGLWRRLLVAMIDVRADPQPVLNSAAESGSELVEIVAGLIERPTSWKLIGKFLHGLSVQQELLTAMCRIVDSDTFDITLKLAAERVRGWVVKVDSRCCACGYNAIGLGIDARALYRDWEARMRKHDIAGDGLVCFANGDVFHLSCLRKLSK